VVKRCWLILAAVVILAAWCRAVERYTVPDADLPQAITVEQLQEQISDLEAENQRQQEEIGKLRLEYEVVASDMGAVWGVSEDLDSRLGRVEGRW